jgi:hypothetical protein
MLISAIYFRLNESLLKLLMASSSSLRVSNCTSPAGADFLNVVDTAALGMGGGGIGGAAGNECCLNVTFSS